MQLEQSGDALAARSTLEEAARKSPSDVTALTEYAEFLDRYHDPEALSAYRKAIQAGGGREKVEPLARRLTVLDLLAGDREAAARDLEAYHTAGGGDWAGPPAWKTTADEKRQTVQIPGPLHSFGRMAAISDDVKAEDVLPAIARNVVTNGYQASHSNEALEQTEYLKLVHRYLSQARELEKIAGPEKAIKIDICDSPKAGDLLRILGFRMRGGCGSEVVLETVNATRAFLTTDSGFPIADLEQALRTNRPFVYPYASTSVPVLYGPEYWLSSKEKESADFIDAFLGDPSLCRLYLGLSKLDGETADSLRKNVPVQRIRAYAHVLDFFGGMFEIRNGKAVVPGGARSAAAWGELAGASPEQGAAFFEKLMGRDDGWLASLFDALARSRGPVRDYLTEPAHLKRFYLALRGKVTSPGPARPVFRSNADLMLLTTRLRVDAGGRAIIPGGIEVWKQLFLVHPHGKYDGKLTKSAAGWKDPDDVVEALFALCRKAVENEPLKIFMAISDLDRYRARPLDSATVETLADDFRLLGQQYSIFSESPSVSDKTILQYLETAQAITHIRDQALRADTAGTLQALTGLWQIFTRQETLPSAQADAALSGIVSPFAQVRGDRDLFDAGRSGVAILLKSTGMAETSVPQDRLVDLLAGAAQPPDNESHTEMVEEMVRILEAQRIVSLNTLFQLADHLQSLAKGGKLDTALVARLASRVGEIQLPRSAMTGVEKNAFAFGYWTEKHVDAERKLNIRAVIDRAGGDAEKLKQIRGTMAPFLRDTLVALNYAHYAPPGAQILYTNPLFVRSHDFVGLQGATHTWKTTEMFGTGWPANGGGRLVGSMVGLPYALAEAEQNFLVPTHTQALIWSDLVPQMILSAKIPRWWNVTPAQVHWVGLHMWYGQSLLAEAALDPALRGRVLDAIAAQAPPARVVRVGLLLEQGDVPGAIEKLTPLEIYAVAAELAPARRDSGGPLLAGIRSLADQHAAEVTPAAISRAFGTPKPTLANSYRPELLYVRTFPTLMGYSSRIMAESWESNTLYWVALADEVHVPPSQLNVLIPQWTQRVVESIFASHLDDWPALLQSLRVVGDDVRARSRQPGADQKAGL